MYVYKTWRIKQKNDMQHMEWHTLMPVISYLGFLLHLQVIVTTEETHYLLSITPVIHVNRVSGRGKKVYD